MIFQKTSEKMNRKKVSTKKYRKPGSKMETKQATSWGKYEPRVLGRRSKVKWQSSQRSFAHIENVSFGFVVLGVALETRV